MNKQLPHNGPLQVFLSHAVRDEPVAILVKQRMEDFGLSVFPVSPPELLRSAEVTEGVRQALLRSTAFVALVTSSYKDSPALALELGAAWGRRLPVHLLVVGDDVGELPTFLRPFPAYSLSQLSELIAALGGEARVPSAQPA